MEKMHTYSVKDRWVIGMWKSLLLLIVVFGCSHAGNPRNEGSEAGFLNGDEGGTVALASIDDSGISDKEEKVVEEKKPSALSAPASVIAKTPEMKPSALPPVAPVVAKMSESVEKNEALSVESFDDSGISDNEEKMMEEKKFSEPSESASVVSKTSVVPVAPAPVVEVKKSAPTELVEEKGVEDTVGKKPEVKAAVVAASSVATATEHVSAAGLPEMGSLMMYVVQPKETLSQISKKIYGNGSRWKELAQLSHLKNANEIYPGDVIYYPLSDKTTAFATKQLQPLEHQVVSEPQTSLKKIAKEVYGDSAYWRMIWRENGNIQSPFHIKKGTVIYYPAKSLLHSAALQIQAPALDGNASHLGEDLPLYENGRLMGEWGQNLMRDRLRV